MYSKESLRDSILEPFALFDEIVSEWTFEDGEISCYNYWACLGQGIFFPIITLVIQVCVLILISRCVMRVYINFTQSITSIQFYITTLPFR